MEVPVLSLALFLSSALAGGPSVDVVGECPGEVELDITGVTRGARIAVLFGDGAGAEPIPGGPCAGTDSGLSGELSWVGPVRDPDADGRFLLMPRLRDGLCDRTLSVLDLESCAVSSAVRLGVPDGEFTTSQIIDGATVTCSSVENTPEYTQCNDLQVDGLYFPNGITCGPTWSSENSSYSDTVGFCASLTGSEAIEVYYTCEETRDRATWFDHVWGMTTDNGYTQHVRCFWP